MSSNDVDYFCGNRFLAHFWPILEPKYGHLKAFLGPKMTKTRSKQPKMAQNHPKMVRNGVGTVLKKSIFGHFGVILGSFWGHFGSFWVILGHFEPKKWPNIAYKSLTWPQTTLMARKMAQNRIFFSFCMENTHFSEFCHHGFQNRLKTSIFDQNRSILAQMKAKTMLFHVVQSASLSRFYRKHYLPSNVVENWK